MLRVSVQQHRLLTPSEDVMAKKKKKWSPIALDAMNLAALRYALMSIEQTVISIYAGDDLDRTDFANLQEDLRRFKVMLREAYQHKPLSSEGRPADSCYDDWVL